jgi:hypothetical protein
MKNYAKNSRCLAFFSRGSIDLEEHKKALKYAEAASAGSESKAVLKKAWARLSNWYYAVGEKTLAIDAQDAANTLQSRNKFVSFWS